MDAHYQEFKGTFSQAKTVKEGLLRGVAEKEVWPGESPGVDLH